MRSRNIIIALTAAVLASRLDYTPLDKVKRPRPFYRDLEGPKKPRPAKKRGKRR